VWCRRNVVATECPKSLITPQSAGYLELFWLRKRLADFQLDDMDARTAEAMALLEEAYCSELSQS